jgi:aspartate/tyrosine/aromatic aminotransferase
MAPRDPILGLNEQFNADPNPAKVNLGVGVYFNDEGKLPVLRCVAQAEQQLLAAPKPKATCPSTALPPTTRPCRAWCSAPTAPWSRPAAWPPSRPWAAPAA